MDETLEYLKTKTHLYVLGDKLIWCPEKGRSFSISGWRSLFSKQKAIRCDGCGMIIGEYQ